jgi:hypothetical protein
MKGNTEGSLFNNFAYIAGFLDGDGSLMLQLKKRSDSKNKYRFMSTICFYQDSRHSKHLKFIKKVLKSGYLSERKDGMTELRIQGFDNVEKILKNLKPHIKFKDIQVKTLLKALEVLKGIPMQDLSKKHLKFLVNCILTIQKNNYSTKSKKTKEDFYRLLNITP